MNTANEIANLIESTKVLMKRRGLRYQDLATHLGVSLPTIKRDFSRQEMSLSRLSKICDWLGASLGDLVEINKIAVSEDTYFTEEQETFFAENPSYLAYLFVLASGKTPTDIQNETGISDRSTRRYMDKLERMKLVRITSKGSAVALIKGAIVWNDDGILGRKLSTSLIQNFSAHLVKSLTGEPVECLELRTWKFTRDNIGDFKRDVEELSKKYGLISNYNKMILSSDDVSTIKVIIAADGWDDHDILAIRDL